MKFNPGNYEERSGGGGNLIPEGKHRVTVIDHEVGTTSGDYTQVIVTYTDDEGRTRKDWLICEGKAAFQFASLCHAVGCTEEIDLDVPRSVRAAIYNRELEIVVGEETYSGKTQLKVKYRNKIKAGSRREERSEPHNGARREEPPPVSDDDIPF